MGCQTAPQRLTNPRDTAEHNTTHCHGSSLPSMEAMLPAAPTSHSRPSIDHPPTRGGDRGGGQGPAPPMVPKFPLEF